MIPPKYLIHDDQLTDNERDLIAAMRLQPNRTLSYLAHYTGTPEFELTVRVIQLAKMGVVQCDPMTQQWCAVDKGVPVTESVLPGLLNSIAKATT